MPPHHFDPWHGAPIRNPPDGVWFRGGPPGGPYGPGGPPGSYPLEPFGYYHTQLPARPLPNSQAGPFTFCLCLLTHFFTQLLSVAFMEQHLLTQIFT